jgi:hypothetical protein
MKLENPRTPSFFIYVRRAGRERKPPWRPPDPAGACANLTVGLSPPVPDTLQMKPPAGSGFLIWAEQWVDTKAKRQLSLVHAAQVPWAIPRESCPSGDGSATTCA